MINEWFRQARLGEAGNPPRAPITSIRTTSRGARAIRLLRVMGELPLLLQLTHGDGRMGVGRRVAPQEADSPPLLFHWELMVSAPSPVSLVFVGT